MSKKNKRNLLKSHWVMKMVDPKWTRNSHNLHKYDHKVGFARIIYPNKLCSTSYVYPNLMIHNTPQMVDDWRCFAIRYIIFDITSSIPDCTYIYISTSNPHCGFYPPNYHAYPNNHPRNHALPIVCYYIVNPILYHRFCWLQ